MREIAIDWAALHSAFQMNMPEIRCFLSVEDGRVLKLPPGDPTLAAVRADPQRYLPIEAIPSRIQYQWLAEFINSVTEEPSKSRMEAAINGKGAFRRFKDILLTMPEERRRWFECRDQMMRRRIVEWVQEHGLTPSNTAPWLDDETYGNAAYSAMAGGESTNASFAHGVAASSTMPAPAPVSHLSTTPAPSVPDNVGNVAPLRAAPSSPRRATTSNHPHEIEALRDFLIEWSDQRATPSQANPLELEELASEIAKRFEVKSVQL